MGKHVAIIIRRPATANNGGARSYAGQLGLPGFHTVVIGGRGNDNTVTGGSESWFTDQIAAALNEHGIGTIGRPRVTRSGSVVNFEVEVNALATHNGEAVRQMVQTFVGNRQYTYGAFPFATGRYVLADVSTWVISDDAGSTPLPPAQPGYTPAGTPPAQPPAGNPNNYGVPGYNPAAYGSGNFFGTSSSNNGGNAPGIFDQIGTTLGVAAGTATLIVLGVIVFALKK